MKRRASYTDKCRYCGNPIHASKDVVCDTIKEHPLPYKTSLADTHSASRNTEPLKLSTQNTNHV